VAGDKERRCKLPKREQLPIVAEHACAPLPYGGLTGREFKGRRRWEGMSESEKAAMRDRLVKHALKGREQGGGV
jgi:hypothetical protein